MEVVVFGAGSLGSLVGGLLARENDVTLVGRDPHMATIQANGLQVTGIDEFVVSPATTTDGRGLTADLVVVTVKAFDTAEAARVLETGSYDGAISLQNGMGNEEVLAGQLDCPVLAGVTSHGALLREPGVVEWTGRGEVALGGWEPRDSLQVERVAGVFESSDLEPRVVDDMRPELWLKLAVNAAINPITALARVENGAIRDGPAAAVARAVAREVASVARVNGVDLADQVAIERVEAVAEATARNRSSMLQDVTSRERTEIDQITGYVTEHAGDIDVPLNHALTALIRAWEAGEGLR